VADIMRSINWRDIVPLALCVIVILIAIFTRSDQISRWPFISLQGSNAGISTPGAQ
jgi:hypothetical protein